MIPAQLPAMIVAEVRKIWTGVSAPLAVLLSVLVGALVAWGVSRIANMEPGSVQLQSGAGPSQSLSDLIQTDVVVVAGWALRFRSAYLLPPLLAFIAASSVAGELSDRTLRELLVRPVPRWSVLLAKYVALSSVVVATLIGTALPAFGLGQLMVGPALVSSELQNCLIAYVASGVCDLAVLSIVVLASLLLRSVGGVVVVLVLLFGFDLGVRGVLLLLAQLGVDWAGPASSWTLGNALLAWETWVGGQWDPARFVALAVVWGLTSAASAMYFSKMDVG